MVGRELVRGAALRTAPPVVMTSSTSSTVRPSGSPPSARAAEGYQVYADPAGHPFCLCWG